MSAIAKLRLRITAFQVVCGMLFFAFIHPSVTGALGFTTLLTVFVMYFIAEFRYGYGGYYLPTAVVVMSAEDPELDTWTKSLLVIFLLLLVSLFIH